MRYAKKADTTAVDLRARARAQGVRCLPLGGVIDDLWLIGGRVLLVDYKTPKRGRKTEAQAELDEAGWPILYIETAEQVDDLIRQARRA
jgi:ATP-dependent exoDNAse (exonuclease V) beta subunit